MRNLILGAAVLLAGAFPGLAAAKTGYVGASYSNVDVDGVGDADAWGVDGSVAFAGSASISFTVDAAFTDSDAADTSWGIAGHAYSNDTSRLIGAFLAYADNDTSSAIGGGLEAQKYLGDWTLAGAVSYTKDDDADVSAVGVNGEARYFVTDNLRLQANAGWFNVDAGTASDDTAIAFGVGGEYQFAAAPISIGLGYTHASLDDANVDADAVSVTARWNFGAGTLRDRDHNGAGLAGLSGVGSALAL